MIGLESSLLSTQQKQTQEIETANENILEERRQGIDTLVRGVQEVSDLFMDVSLLVQEQGHHLDNIETNIQNSNNNIVGANTQLIKANRYQKRKRRYATRCLCILIGCITLGIIIIIKHSKN